MIGYEDPGPCIRGLLWNTSHEHTCVKGVDEMNFALPGYLLFCMGLGEKFREREIEEKHEH